MLQGNQIDTSPTVETTQPGDPVKPKLNDTFTRSLYDNLLNSPGADVKITYEQFVSGKKGLDKKPASTFDKLKRAGTLDRMGITTYEEFTANLYSAQVQAQNKAAAETQTTEFGRVMRPGPASIPSMQKGVIDPATQTELDRFNQELEGQNQATTKIGVVAEGMKREVDSKSSPSEARDYFAGTNSSLLLNIKTDKPIPAVQKNISKVDAVKNPERYIEFERFGGEKYLEQSLLWSGKSKEAAKAEAASIMETARKQNDYKSRASNQAADFNALNYDYQSHEEYLKTLKSKNADAIKSGPVATYSLVYPQVNNEFIAKSREGYMKYLQVHDKDKYEQYKTILEAEKAMREGGEAISPDPFGFGFLKGILENSEGARLEREKLLLELDMGAMINNSKIVNGRYSELSGLYDWNKYEELSAQLNQKISEANEFYNSIPDPNAATAEQISKYNSLQKEVQFSMDSLKSTGITDEVINEMNNLHKAMDVISEQGALISDNRFFSYPTMQKRWEEDNLMQKFHDKQYREAKLKLSAAGSHPANVGNAAYVFHENVTRPFIKVFRDVAESIVEMPSRGAEAVGLSTGNTTLDLLSDWATNWNEAMWSGPTDLQSQLYPKSLDEVKKQISPDMPIPTNSKVALTAIVDAKEDEIGYIAAERLRDEIKWAGEGMNTSVIPSKISEGIAQLYMFATAGGASQKINAATGLAQRQILNPGVFASAFVMEYDNQYESALASGLSPGEASRVASATSFVISALELIVQEHSVLSGFRKGISPSVYRDLANGIGIKTALMHNASQVLGTATMEGLEEALQYLGEQGTKHLWNVASGKDLLDAEINGNQFAEAATLGAALGLLMGGKSMSSRSSLQKAVIYNAALDREGFEAAMKSHGISDERMTEFNEILDRYKESLDSFNEAAKAMSGATSKEAQDSFNKSAMKHAVAMEIAAIEYDLATNPETSEIKEVKEGLIILAAGINTESLTAEQQSSVDKALNHLGIKKPAAKEEEYSAVDDITGESETTTDSSINEEKIEGELSKYSGYYVNYQGIEGTLFTDKNGVPSLLTEDGDVIVIEGGLSDNTSDLGISIIQNNQVSEDDIELGWKRVSVDVAGKVVRSNGKEYQYVGINYDKKGNPLSIEVIDSKGQTKTIRSKEAATQAAYSEMVVEAESQGVTIEQVIQTAEDNGIKEVATTEPTQQVQEGGQDEDTSSDPLRTAIDAYAAKGAGVRKDSAQARAVNAATKELGIDEAPVENVKALADYLGVKPRVMSAASVIKEAVRKGKTSDEILDAIENIDVIQELKTPVNKPVQATEEAQSTEVAEVKESGQAKALVSDVKQTDMSKSLEGGVKVKFGNTTVILSDSNDGVVTVELVKTAQGKKKKGEGSKALKEITDRADATGTTLNLRVLPLGSMDAKSLTEWYERNGFVKVEGSEMMERTPKNQLVESEITESLPDLEISIEEEVVEMDGKPESKEDKPKPKKGRKKKATIETGETVEAVVQEEAPEIIEKIKEKKAEKTKTEKVKKENSTKKVEYSKEPAVVEEEVVLPTVTEPHLSLEESAAIEQAEEDAKDTSRPSKIIALVDRINSANGEIVDVKAIELFESELAQANQLYSVIPQSERAAYIKAKAAITKKRNEAQLKAGKDVEAHKKAESEYKKEMAELNAANASIVQAEAHKQTAREIMNREVPGDKSKTLKDGTIVSSFSRGDKSKLRVAMADAINNTGKKSQSQSGQDLFNQGWDQFTTYEPGAYALFNPSNQILGAAKMLVGTAKIIRESLISNYADFKTKFPLEHSRLEGVASNYGTTARKLYNFINNNNPKLRAPLTVQERVVYLNILGGIYNKSKTAQSIEEIKDSMDEMSMIYGLAASVISSDDLASVSEMVGGITSLEGISKKILLDTKKISAANTVQEALDAIDQIITDYSGTGVQEAGGVAEYIAQNEIKQPFSLMREMRKIWKNRALPVQERREKLVEAILSIDPKLSRYINKTNLRSIVAGIKNVSSDGTFVKAEAKINDIIHQAELKFYVDWYKRRFAKKYVGTSAGRKKGKSIEPVLALGLDMTAEFLKDGSTDHLAEHNRILADVYSGVRQLDDLTEAELIARSYAGQILSAFTNENTTQLKTIAEALKNDIVDGRQDLSFQIEQEVAQSRKNVTEAVADIDRGTTIDKSHEAAKSEFGKLLKSMVSFPKKYIRTHEDIRGLVDIISKNTGALKDLITNPLFEARQKSTSLYRGYMDIYKSGAESIFGKNWESYLRHQKDNYITISGAYDPSTNSDLQLSQSQAAFLYAQSKDPSQRMNVGATLVGPYDTMLMAEQEYLNKVELAISNMTLQIDPRMKAWANWLTKNFYPKVLADVQPVYKQVFKAIMPVSENYAGTAHKKGYVPEESLNPLLTGRLGNSQMGGSTKSRIKNSYQMAIRDIDSVAIAYSAEMAHAVAYAVPMRNIERVINSNEYKDKISASRLSEVDSFMRELLTNLAGKRARQNTMFLNTMASLGSVAILGLNTLQVLKQAVSAPSAAIYVPKGKMGEYFKQFGKNVANPAELRATWKFIYENNADIRDRLDRDFAHRLMIYGDGLRDIAEGKSKLNRLSLVDRGIEFAMAPIKFGDKISIVLGAVPVYQVTYEHSINSGMTHEDAMKEGFKNMNLAISKSFQSGYDIDKDILAANPNMRTLQMFQSASRAQWRATSHSVRQFRKRWNGDPSEESYIRSIYSMLYHHAFTGVMMEFINQGLTGLLTETPDDEEDKKELAGDYLQAAVLGNINAIFLIGDMFSAVVNAARGKDQWMSDVGVSPYFDLMAKAGSNFGEIVSGRAKDEDVLKKIAEMSMVIGVPGKNILNRFLGTQKLLKGDFDSMQEAVLLIAGYNEKIADKAIGAKGSESGGSRTNFGKGFGKGYGKGW